MKYSRREFFKAGAAVALAASLTACGHESKKEPPAPSGHGEIVGHSKGIPMRKFGKTDRVVTILGIGGTGVMQGDDSSAAGALVRRALELGITYLDTAQNYRNGQSEKNYGQVLATVPREQYYLNSKVWVRDYASAKRLIDQTLENLQVPYLDCLMLHGLDSRATVEETFSKDGALRAIKEARDRGQTRLIGFSGHANPESLQLAMNRYPDFDVALMAINPADRRKQPFRHRCYQQAIDTGLGVVNMKPLGGGGGGMIRSQGGVFEHRDLMHYAFSLPGHVTITCVNSIPELEQAVSAAKSFSPLTVARMAQMEQEAEALSLGSCLGFRSPMA